MNAVGTTPVLSVWCANTVLLSESIYTRFSMLNVEDYVDSTSAKLQRLSLSPSEAWVVGGDDE